MATKKPTDTSKPRKGGQVVLLRPAPGKGLSAAAELRQLAEQLRSCAASAETIAGGEDDGRTRRESLRLRRMLVLWQQLNAESDVDARMHFAEGLQFFASVTRHNDRDERDRLAPSWNAVLARAGQLVGRIEMLYPSASKRIDVALTAQAIARIARTSRWDWKTIAKAWGDLGLDPEGSWRVEWGRWSKSRRNP